MRQFSRFVIVGVANTAIGYCVIFACMYLVGLSPELSNVAGYTVGLVVSYLLNRGFTFRSMQPRRTEFVRFVIVFLIAYSANLALLIVLVRTLSIHAGLSQFLAGIFYVLIAYILNKLYVFCSPEAP